MLRAPRTTQVELKTGEIYRGDLEEAEDNWNVQLTKVGGAGSVWHWSCAGSTNEAVWSANE